MPRLIYLDVLLIGCMACRGSSDGIAPGTSYELASYEGRQLPTETFSILEVARPVTGPAVRCANRLTRMSLRFESARSFTQVESLVVSCEDGRDEIRRSEVTKGSYERNRGMLKLLIPSEFGLLQSVATFKGETLDVSSPRPLGLTADSPRLTFPLKYVASK